MPSEKGASHLSESWYVFRNACVLMREQGIAGPAPVPQTVDPCEILFLHGRYEETASWDPLTEGLRGFSGCRLLELPGFGRSFCLDGREMSLQEMVELAAEVARTLINQRPHARWLIGGSDLGALIAQLAALELHRSRVTSQLDLVLLSPASLEPYSRARGILDSFLDRRRMRKRIKDQALRLPSSSLTNRIAESWPGPVERGAWTRMMREFPGSVLVLWGGHDPINSGEGVREILRTYKNVDYFLHEQAGHFLPLEDPIWVSDKIREFIFRSRKPQAERMAV